MIYLQMLAYQQKIGMLYHFGTSILALQIGIGRYRFPGNKMTL